MVWEYLAKGKYNRIFVDYSQGLVLKRSIRPNHPYDHPKRSVRLWNLINANLYPPAKLHPDGWTCPFISGRQATDLEIQHHLIDIYERSGRVVIDACSPKNMIYANEYEQVLCIDIGMAVLMEVQDSDNINRRSHLPTKRRSSLVSNQIWNTLHHQFNLYFITHHHRFPLTITTIKALLVLRQYEPYASASFMLSYPRFLNQIARYYDKKVLDSVDKKILKQLVPINLTQIKNSLIMEIEVILEKYGDFSPTGQFKTSCWSHLFRNTHRIRFLQILIRDLHRVTEPDQLEELLNFNLDRQKSSRTCCPDIRLAHCLERYLTLTRTHLTNTRSLRLD